MSRQATRRRGSSLAPLGIVALVVVVIIVAVIVYVMRSHAGSNQSDNQQAATAQATVAALRTVVADQQAHAIAQQTQIAQLQHTIVELQQQPIAASTQTPLNQSNGPHSYLASFQQDKYTYVIFLQWTESAGFIRNGHLRTTDNYAPKASESLQFDGVNNNGSYGFTSNVRGATTTFTGKANTDGTFTVIGLPWSVFSGFIGGTFTETLHTATLQDYNVAVANLGSPPQ
jgi:hypothetical protein